MRSLFSLLHMGNNQKQSETMQGLLVFYARETKILAVVVSYAQQKKQAAHTASF